MSVSPRYDIGALLEMSGARSRGNRHDCPKCGAQRTVTHSAEAFYCHRCQWKGNLTTLQKGLGIYQRIPSAEYRELRRKRERADSAAWELYQRVKARRFELLEMLHDLNRLESLAHDAGPEKPETWESLTTAYTDRPGILAELTILENSTAADVMRFLAADAPTRKRAIAGVIERGGLTDTEGKFIEASL